MKRGIFVILLALLSLTSCGSDSNEDLQPKEEVVVKDSIPTLKGEFIFLSDAAVFKGNDQFDMIPVTLKGKIISSPGTKGWDEFIEIREVLSISVPKEEPADSASN